MPGINVEMLAEQLRRLQADSPRGMAAPVGDHVARLVAVKQATDKRGRPLCVALFEITDAGSTGLKIETPVWGHAERLVRTASNIGKQFTLRVYNHRGGDGRDWRRVNIEAIRLSAADGQSLPPAAVVVPDQNILLAASAEFIYGFRCVGTIKARRQIVNWKDDLEAMARCERNFDANAAVYLSVFAFTQALEEHQRANDRKDEEHGKPKRGSLENFTGLCYAPLLTIDIDRRVDDTPDPAAALPAAIALVVALLELGVPPEWIAPFYSGQKGYHVQIPSVSAGATPARDFHLVAKEFCTLIAERSGVEIDVSLYNALQPLRAPNSRHPKTGLYKVRLSLDELIDLPFDRIRDLAKQPRVFEPPIWAGEPVPALVSLWQQATQTVRVMDRAAAIKPQSPDTGAAITRATWDYLLNGAEPGSRAESHFRAAANLADFGSLEELVHALMTRPAGLDGWPPREAEAHVERALRRAAERQQRRGLLYGNAGSERDVLDSADSSAGKEHGGAATSG
jgi:hypothetical protein